MSLRIKICDVTVRERVIELPDNCSECGVALREAVLTGWEYQDQKRCMSVSDGGVIDFDEEDRCAPEGGEAFISYVTLVCSCGHFLVEGDMTWIEPEPKPIDWTDEQVKEIGDRAEAIVAPVRARLDADRVAKPKTRLVGHAREGERVGPGLVQPDAIEDTATGVRTPLHPRAAKRYTVREAGSRQIVAGLDGVPADNANLTRLVPTVPIGDLGLHEKTLARRNGEVYEIIRVK